MGYSTLYGDTAGAFAPLGGLYKTDVYAVGRAGATRRPRLRAPCRPCPSACFAKPPSAELCARPGGREEHGQ